MTVIVTGNVHVCAYVMGCDVMWRACAKGIRTFSVGFLTKKSLTFFWLGSRAFYE